MYIFCYNETIIKFPGCPGVNVYLLRSGMWVQQATDTSAAVIGDPVFADDDDVVDNDNDWGVYQTPWVNGFQMG